MSVKGSGSCRDNQGEHNWPSFKNHRFRTAAPTRAACSERAQTLISWCLGAGVRARGRGGGALDALSPDPRSPLDALSPDPLFPRQRRLRSPERRARGRPRGGAGRVPRPLSPLGAGPAPSPRLSPAGAAAAGTGEAERSGERSAGGSGARSAGGRKEGRKEEEEEKKQEEEEKEEEQREEGGSAGRAAPGAPLRARRGSAAAPRSRRDAPAALPQP